MQVQVGFINRPIKNRDQIDHFDISATPGTAVLYVSCSRALPTAS